jgi:hypothetical protein
MSKFEKWALLWFGLGFIHWLFDFDKSILSSDMTVGMMFVVADMVVNAIRERRP